MTQGCSDERYANMLYAYELGLLSESDEGELETHLIECRHCFSKALKLEKAADLILRDPEVCDKVEKMAGTSPSPPDGAIRRRKRSLRILPVSLVAAVVLILLLVKDWQFDIRPHQPAVAAQNRLAIMYFRNLADPTDPERLGQIITSLLITDLSESRYLEVVSSQRLYDILKVHGMENARSINRDIATQVAIESQSEWMLIGSILQVEPQLIVISEVVDLNRGTTIAGLRLTAGAEEGVFSLVDSITAQLKHDLPLPSAARRETHPLVADVTTYSEKAYRHYVAGLDSYYRIYLDEAARSFEEAVRHDSTFAMAYYYLARTRDKSYIVKASEYAGRASSKQQCYIRSLQASFEGDVSGAIAELEGAVERYPEDKHALQVLARYLYSQNRFREAIEYLTRVVKIDPLEKFAYNMLSYSYAQIGNMDKSIWAIEQYIFLAPDEANPYDTRGEILAHNGRIDDAIESFKTSLEIKPDFHPARINLGLWSVLGRRYEIAEHAFQKLVATDDDTTRSIGRLYLAYVPFFQAKFRLALKLADEAIAGDEDDQTLAHPSKFGLKAIIYRDIGDLPSALRMLDQAVRLSRQLWPEYEFFARRLRVQVLAEMGELEAAEQAAEGLRRDLAELNHEMSPYWYATGTIRLVSGNPADATAAFEAALKDSVAFSFSSRYMLGVAYLRSGRPDEAIDEFQRLNHYHPDQRLFFASWSVMSHYYMGVAYENSERTEDAIEEYTVFLDIWNDADSGIAEIQDAARRLDGL